GDLLQRATAQGSERARHLLRARGQLATAGELAVRAQRRLLAARPVQRADAAGLQAERDDALERARLLLVRDAARRDRVGELCQQVGVRARLRGVAHGLHLGQRDIALLGREDDRARRLFAVRGLARRLMAGRQLMARRRPAIGRRRGAHGAPPALWLRATRQLARRRRGLATLDRSLGCGTVTRASPRRGWRA